MLIKQKEVGKAWAKVKYSDLNKGNHINATVPTTQAGNGVRMLLSNHYAAMDGYAINEVLKAIRSLRELGIEYTVKVIEKPNSKDMYYEFTTPLFEDDRK